jgi:hypothetical protein
MINPSVGFADSSPCTGEPRIVREPKAFPLLWGRCHDEGVTDEEYMQKSGTLFADG